MTDRWGSASDSRGSLTVHRRSGANLFGRGYRPALLVVALLVVVAGIVALVVFLGSRIRPSQQLLTITRPVNGTLSAAGITCGTRGANCSTNRPNGDAIELTPEADAGIPVCRVYRRLRPRRPDGHDGGANLRRDFRAGCCKPPRR